MRRAGGTADSSGTVGGDLRQTQSAGRSEGFCYSLNVVSL